MIESKLKANNCNVDSCFDLVGFRQHGVASYSVYFWLIRSLTDPAFTGSIFVCGPLHHFNISFAYFKHFSNLNIPGIIADICKR